MRVPVYNPQARSSGLPGVHQQGALPVVQVGAQQAQQTEQLGQAITGAGNQLARIQINVQAEANQLRVDDAINKAREAAQRHTYDPQAGYLSIKGEAALNRQSGKPLVDEYSDLLDTDLKGIADSLGNDAQRAAFSRVQQELTSRFREQVMRHEGQEYQAYRASVREGTISNRTNEIALAYNNPQVVTENIESIKAAVWDLGQLKGWSAAKIEAQQRDATSVAHRTALAAALQHNDAMYADSYMKRFSHEMNADDILRVQGLITKDMDAKLGAAAANQVVGEVLPRFMPSDSDRLANIINTEDFARLDAAKVNAESGGRRYSAGGTLLAGPFVPGQGTAKGEHQVMDATNRDPGYGVRPAQDDSPEERARVGKEYLAAMLKEYGGNVPMALAAYNAGPGNVNKALAEARKAAGIKAGPPPEASNVVEEGNIDLTKRPRVRNADGSISTVRTMGVNIDGLEVLIPTVGDDGRIMSEDDAIAQYQRTGKHLGKFLTVADANTYAQALHEHQDGFYNSAPADWMRYLPKPHETVPYVQKIMAEFATGKGAPPAPTLSEVLTRVRQQVGDSNPERLKIALDAAEKQFKLVQADIKAREDKVVADAMRGLQTNGGRYDALPLSLRGAVPPGKVDQLIDYGKNVNQVETNPAVYLQMTDPAKLNSLSDDQFYALRAELDSSDWEYFAKQRGGRAAPAEKLNTTAISRVLKNRLASLGMDTTPKDGTKDAARLGAIRSFVDKTILQEQAVTGKEMTDAEIEKHIDKLMVATSEVSSWFGLVKSNERVLTQDAGDIPANIRKALKADFKRMGIDSPTDADLFGAYLQFQYQSQRTAADLKQLNQETVASGE